MSKKRQLADLRLYERSGESLALLVSVSARRTGNTRHPGYELYVTHHTEIIGGRQSFHASGVQIGRIDLIKKEERTSTIPIAQTTRIRPLVGVTIGPLRGALTATIPEDSERRRSVVISER